MDLYEELLAVVRAFSGESIPYAICGGIALAIHGWPRATKDIDLLVLPSDQDKALLLLRGLGYSIEAAPMKFSSGIIMKRISKAAQEQLLTVDLVLVGDRLASVWQGRTAVAWRGQSAWVVDREGMITMKKLAGRKQDQADLELLGGDDGDD